MKRSWQDYLADILAVLDDLETFTSGISYDEFLIDKKTVYAVVRALEVMGEAAKQVPEAIRQANPGVPWKRMAAARDKLIHGYFGIDVEIVWTIATVDAPAMKPHLESMAAGLDPPRK